MSDHRFLLRVPRPLWDRVTDLPAVKSGAMSQNRLIVEAISEYVGGEGGLKVVGQTLDERLAEGLLCEHARIRSVCPLCKEAA